jgi:hypothetical protein
MRAYIANLTRQVEQANTVNKTNSLPLRLRLEAWHRNLPPVARNRPFAMAELEAAMDIPGRLLSATLIEAGWTRKRRWQGTAHYFRYWLPPHV